MGGWVDGWTKTKIKTKKLFICPKFVKLKGLGDKC